MSAQEQTAPPPKPVGTTREPKPRPAWMNESGAPMEPRHNDLIESIKLHLERKKDALEIVRELRGQLDAHRNEIRRQREEQKAALNEALKSVSETRDAHSELAAEKVAELRIVKAQRQKLIQELKGIGSVKAFHSEEEIDEAIAHLEYEMATGSGSLNEEKRNQERIKQLERARGLYVRLRPLDQAIADADAEVAELRKAARREQDEAKKLSQEIVEKLNHDRAQAQELMQSNAISGVDEKKTRALIAQHTKTIDEANRAIDKARAEFNEKLAVWNAWKDDARARYQAERDAMKAERRKIRELAIAKRLQREQAERGNPYDLQASVVQGLIQFLQQYVINAKQACAEEERRERAANYNPTASAPEGMILCQTRRQGGGQRDIFGGVNTGKKKGTNCNRRGGTRHKTVTTVQSKTHIPSLPLDDQPIVITKKETKRFANISIKPPPKVKDVATTLMTLHQQLNELAIKSSTYETEQATVILAAEEKAFRERREAERTTETLKEE